MHMSEGEILLEERDKCFILARENLHRISIEEGTQENQSIKLHIKNSRRTTKSSKKNIAKEAVEWFECVIGLGNFPRHL